jgi:CsoR family transcriptional regulator, copper-sensing transcriptional repressor
MTHGYSTNRADHLARLRRIEGQIRGLQRMVEEDQYCIDVLTQIASATKALQSVAIRLLDEHLHHCVSHAVAAGGPEGAAKITEATQAIERLLKS